MFWEGNLIINIFKMLRQRYFSSVILFIGIYFGEILVYVYKVGQFFFYILIQFVIIKKLVIIEMFINRKQFKVYNVYIMECVLQLLKECGSFIYIKRNDFYGGFFD